MARIYFDSELNSDITTQLPPEAIGELPIDLVKARLHEVERQRLIPFLGAGASLRPAHEAKPSLPIKRPLQSELRSHFHDYNIRSPLQLELLQAAIVLAQLVGSQSQGSVEQPIRLDEAPSSWELANLLANSLQIDPFESYGRALMDVLQEGTPDPPVDRTRLQTCTSLVREVARLLGIHKSIPQLLTVASYFNARDRMIGLLFNRFRKVTASNAIHSVLVDSAHRFVEARNKPTPAVADKRDFLIITTNYDSLIESELDKAQVPTCVVTVDIATCQMMIDFTNNTQKSLGINDAEFTALQRRYREDERRVLHGIEASSGGLGRDAIFTPKKFTLVNKTHALAMVYKIHGSLEPRTVARDTDSLVISDHDYVEFIQHNGPGNELIPAYVNARLSESRLLFLGYSFSDWNVRGLYRYFLRHRKSKGAIPSPEDRERDFIVMRSFGQTDKLFFEQWDVSVVVVDLDKFARELVGCQNAA